MNFLIGAFALLVGCDCTQRALTGTTGLYELALALCSLAGREGLLRRTRKGRSFSLALQQWKGHLNYSVCLFYLIVCIFYYFLFIFSGWKILPWPNYRGRGRRAGMHMQI
jgi:hypothetical protein